MMVKKELFRVGAFALLLLSSMSGLAILGQTLTLVFDLSQMDGRAYLSTVLGPLLGFSLVCIVGAWFLATLYNLGDKPLSLRELGRMVLSSSVRVISGLLDALAGLCWYTFMIMVYAVWPTIIWSIPAAAGVIGVHQVLGPELAGAFLAILLIDRIMVIFNQSFFSDIWHLKIFSEDNYMLRMVADLFLCLASSLLLRGDRALFMPLVGLVIGFQMSLLMMTILYRTSGSYRQEMADWTAMIWSWLGPRLSTNCPWCTSPVESLDRKSLFVHLMTCRDFPSDNSYPLETGEIEEVRSNVNKYGLPPTSLGLFEWLTATVKYVIKKVKS